MFFTCPALKEPAEAAIPERAGPSGKSSGFDTVLPPEGSEIDRLHSAGIQPARL
jgi:hypothetical protein